MHTTHKADTVVHVGEKYRRVKKALVLATLAAAVHRLRVPVLPSGATKMHPSKKAYVQCTLHIGAAILAKNKYK